MAKVIALIRTDLEVGALGLASRLREKLVGRSVLAHAVGRVARVEAVKKIVLLHPAGQDPVGELCGEDFGKAVEGFAFDAGEADLMRASRVAARKWALSAWRGGIGGMTCYDELLPAGPMAGAMKREKAEAALLVGADWVLVDPGYCDAVLGHHLAQPEAMQMVFTQAPPGLAGIAVGREMIEQMGESGATFGQVLGYNPTKAQADPIGRDVCVQVPASVRGCDQRLVFDTGPAAAMIRWVAERAGEDFAGLGGERVVEMLGRIGREDWMGFASLPQQVTVELTPRRGVNGPIVPQRHFEIERSDMPLELALRLVEQMGVDGDTVLTLGGLGDALLYEGWEDVVVAAHEAGVLGIEIETDLLVERAVVERARELPVDVLSVRLNADTDQTYRAVMESVDEGAFEGVIEHLQYLLTAQRAGRAGGGNSARAGLPWVVPRLVKTEQTLGDMETFFDRWMHFAGHAVIDPATTGCGLMLDQGVMPMAPPRRVGCRQLERRMTVLSDGVVARCDQDWLGRAAGGDARVTGLAQIWAGMQGVRDAHAAGEWAGLSLCGGCSEWHRP